MVDRGNELFPRLDDGYGSHFFVQIDKFISISLIQSNKSVNKKQELTTIKCFLYYHTFLWKKFFLYKDGNISNYQVTLFFYVWFLRVFNIDVISTPYLIIL